MTRSVVRFRGAAARRMRGGAVVGFVVGLIAGLALAAFVAVYITHAPVPFVDRASRAPSPVAVPKSAEETPDPNQPLYSKNRPPAEGAAAQAPAQAPSAEESASLLDRLFGKGAAEQAGVIRKPAEQAAAKPPAGAADTRAADAKSAPEARAPEVRAADAKPPEARPAEPPLQTTSYLLQAGAFRSADEADAMKARLALLGLEARVLSAEVNGQTVYRVRVGPYAQLDEMNRARSRLAESGIEASVLRQR